MAKASEKEVETKKEVKIPESKYTREELIANSQVVFNKMPEVVAGAFHEDDRKELTISEASALIKTFLKKKVNK